MLWLVARSVVAHMARLGLGCSQTLYQQLAEIRAKRETGGTASGLGDGSDGGSSTPRLIIVSNSLPFTLTKTGSGWRSKPRNNVPRHHGMSCFAQLHATTKCMWVGQAGTEVEPGVHRSNLKSQLLAE